MKRSAEVIISEINPMKSTKKYNTSWQQFLDYTEIKDRKPTEQDFLQYFDYQRNEKKLAASTLWSSYSMINSKYQLNFGEKLQSFPRLTMQLKSYEAGYVRKTANIFSKEDIFRFIETAPDTNEFIYMKAATIICYYGGLRCADLTSINTDDLEFNEVSGMWVNYSVSKQRGEQIKNKFNIPLEFCGYLERYDHKLADCNASEGRLMKSYRLHKDGSHYYTKQPMGVNIISKITVKIATYLGLANPSTYTGHSLRRTAANILAEAGTCSAAMKKHFNWRNEQTAMKYVDNTTSSKLTISDKMRPSGDTVPSTSNKYNQLATSRESKTITIENCQNIVFNF